MSMTRNEILIALADGRALEVLQDGQWVNVHEPCESSSFTNMVHWIDSTIMAGNQYRIKRTPREWWFNIYKSGIGMPWQSSDTSFEARDISKDFIERVHVREVLE